MPADSCMLRLSCVILLAAAGHSVYAAAQTQPARQPNILVLMTDQHSFGVLGCAGNKTVKTPNLDRLASEGARVTQALCVTPFCSPTRASMWTGQWPHTHGITYNVPQPDREAARRRANRQGLTGLTDEQTILFNLLFDQGYHVGYFGKWHLGDMSDLRCFRGGQEEQGLRSAYRDWLALQGKGVIDRKARPGEVFVETKGPGGGVFMPEAMAKAWKSLDKSGPDLRREVQAIGRSPVAAGAQFEAWLADRAMEWLDRNAAGPFILVWSVGPPHADWVAPDPFYSMYDPDKMPWPSSFNNRPDVYRNSRAAHMGAWAGEAGMRQQLRCYYAQVTMVDTQIGRILARLRELGLDRNTLVVFTSDHGDMQAAHGMMGKSVHAFYEEIVRIPLIFRYAPSIRPGQVLDMHTNSVDLMPTVLDYVGLPIPDSVQGRSLRAVLDGWAEPDDRPGFCERAIRGPVAGRMIRMDNWKYCAYGDGRRELFNLADDPGETQNLADRPEHRDRRKQLEQDLREWMQRTADPALDSVLTAGKK